MRWTPLNAPVSQGTPGTDAWSTKVGTGLQETGDTSRVVGGGLSTYSGAHTHRKDNTQPDKTCRRPRYGELRVGRPRARALARHIMHMNTKHGKAPGVATRPLAWLNDKGGGTLN